MKNLPTSSIINMPLRSVRWSSTYYLPGDLEAQIGHFIEHYNHNRYHESLENLTPADVYFGRGREILEERRRIKRQTLEHRRLQNRKIAA
jgi:putative transposase